MLIVSIVYWIAFLGVLTFIIMLIVRGIRTLKKEEYKSPETKAIEDLVKEVEKLRKDLTANKPNKAGKEGETDEK